MNTFLLTDCPQTNLRFRPLSSLRSISELRLAYFSILDCWNQFAPTGLKNSNVVSGPQRWIYSHVLPSKDLVQSLLELTPGTALYHETTCIAWYSDIAQPNPSYKKIQFTGAITRLNDPMDLIQNLNQRILHDYTLLSVSRTKSSVPNSVFLTGNPADLFIEEGAKVNTCFINVSNGPVFISKHAEVMEGAMIRGPFVLGEHSEVKMGSKIYGPTSIGAWCKIGGELNQCLFQDYSNKAHDGFLGQSLIGSWCNLGADTNCSNLKNNYSFVKQYRYDTCQLENTGAQFAGIIMGDHCKTGINTMLNTGTVLGTATHVYGSGFPPQFVPDFTWFNGKDLEPYRWDKFIETVERVWARRNKALTESDRNQLKKLYVQVYPKSSSNT